ncbi:MAG: DNA polymerase III subunit chi [Asticcacaulis sp.]
MTEVWFYHLEKTALEQALPDLLEKVVGRGWRAYVHGGPSFSSESGGHEADKIASLNQHLWAYQPASFLAHGVEGEGFEDRQPILLGASGGMANAPDVYLSVAPVDPPDISGMKRCLIVFEGIDADHVNWARGLWKRLKGEAHDLAYWKQTDEGRWEKVQ